MLKQTLATFILGGFLTGAASAAPVYNYRILLDGQDLTTATTANFININYIEVTIQLAITGEFGGNYVTGGAYSNGFNLFDSTGTGSSSALHPVLSGYNGSNALWDAVSPVGTTQNSKGYADFTHPQQGPRDVHSAAFTLTADQQADYFETFGGDGVWTTIAVGHFSWDGVTEATLSVAHYAGLVNRYDTTTSTYSRNNTGVTGIGDSVTFAAVPEPTSLALIAAGSLLALRRARKA